MGKYFFYRVRSIMQIPETRMAEFEKLYNEKNFEATGKIYADKCFVTVNGGTEKGGFGPFTEPAQVASFLTTLHNDVGATNMKFNITSVKANVKHEDGSGFVHDDTWTS